MNEPEKKQLQLRQHIGKCKFISGKIIHIYIIHLFLINKPFWQIKLFNNNTFTSLV